MVGDCVPVPLPDEAEAGSLWRGEKLRDFVFRMRCLGLEKSPEFASLLAQIAEQTEALEQLAEQQRQPDYQRPWWQDGEYDSTRADSANDRGQALFTAGQHGAAFHAFTQAIRLAPTSAVYHCNRAAAALKLGRADVAAEDAAAAVQRDPCYLRAHLRAGRAHLQLGQAERAEAALRRALDLSPNNAAATRGLAEAAALRQQQVRQAAEEAAEAQRGSRPGLTREAVSEEAAALQLYAAEQMLAANPRLQSARCAQVEALLLCGRYGDAEASCSQLLKGSTERLYLEAEVAWRQGQLAAAADGLRTALAAVGPGGCAKCSGLLAFLEQLLAGEEEAVAALEQGAPQRCIDACSSLLARLQPRACAGLACALLHRRAEAHMQRQAWAAAVADLDQALALDSAHAACLLVRAEAHKKAGSYTQAFLDLQRLKKAAAGTPGLAALLQEVARLSLGSGPGSRAGSSRDGRGGACTCGGAATEAAAAVLGVPAGVTSAQARQAYLKLAARWHPDKWAGSSEAERQAAEEKFKQVQAAYELLTA